MNVINIAGAVVGGVYVLAVPGLALSFAFFKRGTIDIIERVALGFALSIAVVPLLTFYLNLVGVRINRLNVVLEVGMVTAVALGFAWWRGRGDNAEVDAMMARMAQRKAARIQEAAEPEVKSEPKAAPQPEEPVAVPEPPAVKPPVRRRPRRM